MGETHLTIHGNDSGPRDNVSLGHFIEHSTCRLERPTFRVCSNEIVCNEEVVLEVGIYDFLVEGF